MNSVFTELKPKGLAKKVTSFVYSLTVSLYFSDLKDVFPKQMHTSYIDIFQECFILHAQSQKVYKKPKTSI